MSHGAFGAHAEHHNVSGDSDRPGAAAVSPSVWTDTDTSASRDRLKTYKSAANLHFSLKESAQTTRRIAKIDAVQTKFNQKS